MVLCMLTAERGFLKSRAPPAEAAGMTIKRCVARTGGLAGVHPSKRPPLPGTEKLWQGVRTLAESVLAIRTGERLRMQMGDVESSVLH